MPPTPDVLSHAGLKSRIKAVLHNRAVDGNFARQYAMSRGEETSPRGAGVAEFAVLLDHLAGQLFHHTVHTRFAEELEGCADGKVGQGVGAVHTEVVHSIAALRWTARYDKVKTC